MVRAALQFTAQGYPTHRAGGEVDHILAPARVGCLAGRARVEPGVGKRNRDHMVVWSRYKTTVDREGCGPDRVKGPCLRVMADADWQWWSEEVEKRVVAALRDCGRTMSTT